MNVLRDGPISIEIFLWLGVQRRSNLLVTELVESVGFVGAELMTELGE